MLEHAAFCIESPCITQLVSSATAATAASSTVLLLLDTLLLLQQDGNTPAHLAARRGHAATIKLLFIRGADCRVSCI